MLVERIVSLPVPEKVRTPTAILYVAVDGATNSAKNAHVPRPAPPELAWLIVPVEPASVEVFVTVPVSNRTRTPPMLLAVPPFIYPLKCTRYRPPDTSATACE